MGCCGDMARGAKGIVQAALGLGRADGQIIERRRAICRACPEAIPCVKKAGQFCRCRRCGCVLHFKTALAGESCPLGRWGAQPTDEPKPALTIR